MAITILIADDHPLFVEGLATLLETIEGFSIIGYAYDGADAVQKANELQPTIAILDINMPVMDGIEAVRQMKLQAPDTRILMLSMNDDRAYILRSMQAGANGYLLKNAAKSELVEAINKVAAGKSYFSSDVAISLMQDALVPKPTHAADTDDELLTPREVSVAKLLVQDLTNAEIADKLHISIRTVEGHRMNILRKLHLKSIVGLSKYAQQKGWLDL